METPSDSKLSKVTRAAGGALLKLSFPAAWTWCVLQIRPWLVLQAKSWRDGNGIAAPATGEECLALMGLFVVPVAWFLAYVFVKVWHEIERDQKIYKVTATKIASIPTAARDLMGRWWDAAAGRVGGLFVHLSFTRRYMRELPRLRKYLDLRNLAMTQANHLELEDVYIELKAATRTAKRPADNPVTRELREHRATIWDHLRVLESGVGYAIIGAPGSGKTTLLKHLMLKYAWNQQWRSRVRSRIPFFVELRKLPKWLGKDNPTLADVIARMLKAEDDLKSLLRGMPANWLLNILKRGRCVLLCDGLDEIPNVKTRKSVSEWLDKQINHSDWRDNLFIVTARPAGYEAAPLEQVQGLEVQPFDWEDTRSFIRRWYQANRVISMRSSTPTRTIRDLAGQDADSLLAKLRDHSRLGVLTSNPLLLTMVCLMHEMGQLPGSRSQLYKEICEVHLERWRRKKSDGTSNTAAKSETWNAEQKLMVLRPLARHLMQRGDVVAGGACNDSKRLSTFEMLTVAKDSLDHIGVALDEKSRMGFFTDLHNDSGLWLEWEKDEWGFAHLSFQEYLCADLWFTKPELSPPEATWASYFESTWWRECLLLYASKTTDLRPLIRKALDARTPRSLAFLFALEAETVTMPADLKARVEEELNVALKSQDPAIFTPAAEAWLLRQQEMGYTRIDQARELGAWVTQAEYQLFLTQDGKREYSRWPLHSIGKWFTGDPRSPASGMVWTAAQNYCDWLNQRFPEFSHRLGAQDSSERIAPQNSDLWVTWLAKGSLSTPSKSLLTRTSPERIERLRDHSRGHAVTSARGADAYVYLFDLARALARSCSRSRSRSRARALLVDLARDHDLDLAFDLALDLALALILPLDLALDPDRAFHLAHAIDRTVAFDLDLDRDLAFAIARAFGVGDVLTFRLDNDRNWLKFKSQAEWEQCENSLQQQAHKFESFTFRRRSQFFGSLFPLWSPKTSVNEIPGVFRRFLLTCFGIIREHNPNGITADYKKLEDLIQLLIDREEGKEPAWEGIRVIRERRT